MGGLRVFMARGGNPGNPPPCDTASATAFALSAVAFFTIGLWLKARLEEQFLCEDLGAAAYAPYKARTPRLVPRVPRPGGAV